MKRSLLTFAARIWNGTRSALLLLSVLTLAGGAMSAPLHAQELTTGDVFLRGSHPASNQIGGSYMVFAVRDGQAVGGFYQPQSSFDCFYGSIDVNHMPLTVINSYTNEQYRHTVNLSRETIVANADQRQTMELDPTGSYALAIDDVAQEVLAACQDRLPL